MPEDKNNPPVDPDDATELIDREELLKQLRESADDDQDTDLDDGEK